MFSSNYSQMFLQSSLTSAYVYVLSLSASNCLLSLVALILNFVLGNIAFSRLFMLPQLLTTAIGHFGRGIVFLSTELNRILIVF